MIGYLEGKIIGKGINNLTILTSGVGYIVFVPNPALEKIKEKDDVSLFIHTNVSETAFDLYGFSSQEELKFFRQLISVSGVGPKTALEIMAAPVGKTKAAIIEGNIAFVSAVKGIGKKTAERLCLELKDKVESTLGEANETSVIDEDALAALVSLGYDKSLSEKTLAECPPNIESTEERIKWSLKNF